MNKLNQLHYMSSGHVLILQLKEHAIKTTRWNRKWLVVKLNCIVLLDTEIKILNYWTISPVRHMGQQVDSLKDAKFVCQTYTVS